MNILEIIGLSLLILGWFVVVKFDDGNWDLSLFFTFNIVSLLYIVIKLWNILTTPLW